MPEPANLPGPHSTGRRDPGAAIHKNVHEYYAPSSLRRLLVYRARALLANRLPQVLHALQRDCAKSRQLDIPGRTLLMGHTDGDHV